MPLICSDLLGMQVLKDLKQVAGHDGNNRKIHWATTMEYIERFEKISGNIENGDLVLVPGNNLANNTKSIFVAIEEASRQNGAGIIVYFDKYIENLTSEILELSNSLKFPLYELFIESGKEMKIVKEICKAVIVDDLNETYEASIFKSVLDHENLDSEFVAKRFKACGININNLNQVGIIKVEGFKDQNKNRYLQNDKKAVDLCCQVNDIIRNSFILSAKNIITIIRDVSVIFLTGAFEKGELENMLFKIDRDIKDRLPELNLNFGIGNPNIGVTGIHHSFSEAKQIMMLKQCDGIPGLSTAPGHMDVYLLLLGLKDRKLLEKYLNKVLDPLLTHDKLNQGELFDTMNVYLNENANIMEASNRLFIHRNTLKYRIKKIENLLNVNLHSLEDCLRLLLAVKIHRLFTLSSDTIDISESIYPEVPYNTGILL